MKHFNLKETETLKKCKSLSEAVGKFPNVPIAELKQKFFKQKIRREEPPEYFEKTLKELTVKGKSIVEMAKIMKLNYATVSAYLQIFDIEPPKIVKEVKKVEKSKPTKVKKQIEPQDFDEIPKNKRAANEFVPPAELGSYVDMSKLFLKNETVAAWQPYKTKMGNHKTAGSGGVLWGEKKK